MSAVVAEPRAVRNSGRTAGRLQDIEIDAEPSLVASLVLDTGVWPPGRQRAIVPRELRAIDWIARTIDLG